MKKMKKSRISRIIVQFVSTAPIMIHGSIHLYPIIEDLILLCALLAFQYIIEISILNREKYSKGAIVLIVANLLQINIIPIIPFSYRVVYHAYDLLLIPIVFMNFFFAIRILTQISEKRARLIMKRAYDVCSIVFIILLSSTVVATLIVSILFLTHKAILLGLALILLILVAFALIYVIRYSQKKFEKYVLNAEELLVSSLIITAYIVINLGMIFVCWLPWFGAIFFLAGANGYRG